MVAGNLAGVADAGQLSGEELEARITDQDAVIAALRGQSVEQQEMIAEVRAEIVELQGKLDENSRN